jgi:hydrogenase maturation protein HypF
MQAANDWALVATSANLSGEPIVMDGAEARTRLAGIADAIAGHDRPIATRADDSVMRIVAGAPSFIRRARGFTPWPIPLAADGPPVVALGGQLKATVAVLRGREAFVSQHIGDLDTPAAVGFLTETLRHMLDILEVTPAAVACDAHPDFPSSLLAGQLGVPVFPVQHHHAHVASLAAESGVTGPLLGLALDGYGLGADGGAWGGELLLADGVRCDRLGHLAPLPAPGGDRAAREPWRMAAAVLHRLGQSDQIAARFPGEPLAGAVRQLLDSGTASAPTSSCGRLFDAVAALLGVSLRQSFEGEAAMRLEALVSRPAVLADGWRIAGGVLDLSPLLGQLANESDPARGAGLFHGTLMAALADWVEAAATRTGLRHVALGGGCFLNRVLTEGVAERLTAAGLRPLIARAVPPNDGGLALGQALVARTAVTDGPPGQTMGP